MVCVQMSLSSLSTLGRLSHNSALIILKCYWGCLHLRLFVFRWLLCLSLFFSRHISLPSHGAVLPPASLVTIPLVAGPSVRWSRPSPTQLDVVPSTLVSQPGTGPHSRLDTPTYCGLSLSPAMEPFPRKLVE